MESPRWSEVTPQQIRREWSVVGAVMQLGIAYACARAGYDAYYDLFVIIADVHMARILLPWDAASMCASVTLLSAMVTGCMALGLLLARPGSRWRPRLWAAEIGGIAVLAVAYLWWVHDFFGTAGQFGAA